MRRDDTIQIARALARKTPDESSAAYAVTMACNRVLAFDKEHREGGQLEAMSRAFKAAIFADCYIAHHIDFNESSGCYCYDVIDTEKGQELFEEIADHTMTNDRIDYVRITVMCDEFIRESIDRDLFTIREG